MGIVHDVVSRSRLVAPRTETELKVTVTDCPGEFTVGSVGSPAFAVFSEPTGVTAPHVPAAHTGVLANAVGLVLSVLVLFAAPGSSAFLTTLAVFVKTCVNPAPGMAAGVTVPTTVTVVVVPEAREFKVHGNAPPAQPNVGELTDLNVTPVGRVLLNVKICDGCGPILLIVTT